ncbi:hypothetical protein JD969_15595 [Planctomycetota bacterium]|nr:hypothetical protein JD969_15595 [Planctomycetota bacterium]
MRVIRFSAIVVVITLMLMVLSAWGGYMMGRNAVHGISIGEKQVGITSRKTLGADQKADSMAREKSAQDGIRLGGLLGIFEGLVVGVAIAWGDLYFSKKKQMNGESDDE